MGATNYKKLPNNIIYNVYLKCEEEGYKNVTSSPFFDGKGNDLKIPCSINIISPDSTFQSEGDLHLIGYGSRLYKKLSWNIKFSDKNKFMGRKTLKLRGIANDNSLMREKLATEICNSLDVPTQEGSYARLFINDDIYGLYLLGDSFNKRWLGAYVHGDEKAKIGFSYRLISSTPDGPFADLRYIDEKYKSYKRKGTYEVDEFEKDAVDPNDESTKWAPLIKFTKLYDEWVKNYKNDNSDAAVEALQKFLNIESVLRVLVVDTLTLPLDNFWLIMSNAVLYYNPDQDNYQIIPFDFDQSFRGSWGINLLDATNYIKDCITWVNYNETSYEHYFTNHLLEQPQIRKRYDVILSQVVRSTFDSQKITNFVQSIAKLIRDDVQWNVDAVNNLKIPYDGIVKSFDLKKFDRSYTNTYKKGSSISSSYDLKEFIDIRGDYCRAYTADIDTSDTNNIGKSKQFVRNIVQTEIQNEQSKIQNFNETEIQTTEIITINRNQNETPIETQIEIQIENSDSSSQKFNVVSILKDEYKIGVMYGDKVIPLNSTLFPLFSGIINGENISEYKYVVLDSNNEVVETESISRIYSNETSIMNEVYNRNNKMVSIPELPSTLEQIYPLGSNRFKPFPDDVIYNVYANCDKEGYSRLTTSPFFNGMASLNELSIDCTINIISPDSSFQSKGSLKLYGFNSRRFKKLSWIVSLNENKFLGRQSLKMKGIANDHSLMREKFASRLYNTVNVPTQEGAFARFFINDDAYGLYMISDNLNKEWIEAYIHGNKKEKIGNNYYGLSSPTSGPFADLKYLGEDYNNYIRNIYEVHSFENNLNLSSQYTELVRFTKLYNDWVERYHNTTSIEAVNALQQFLDVESTLRLLAVETLIIPLDNFWLIGSNTALYYNPEKNVYQFLPYELDQSLVGSWDISSLEPENYIKDCITWASYKENKNDQYFTSHLLSHPLIKKRYDIILAEIVHSSFDSHNVQNYLNGLADLIRDDVQWNIDVVNNLKIPYQGIVTSFAMDNFERSLNYKYIETHRSYYELWEFVDIRSNYCKVYTANVDVSENIFESTNHNNTFSTEIPIETQTDVSIDIPTETQTEVSVETPSLQNYQFNVVSILGEGYSMGVKINDKIIPLESKMFPLFGGSVNDNLVTEYKYVALDNNNRVVEEESISRIYSKETSNINEVYNRSNKNITITEPPSPFTKSFSMDNDKYPKIPDNVIYNFYAKCEEVGYKNLTGSPFIKYTSKINDNTVNCTINIISPDGTFQDEGTMKVIGFTSRLFKKLTWGVKLNNKKFFGRKSFKLRAMANDRSLRREKFATRLYNTVGVPTHEGAYARVFINGDTYGLFLLSDSTSKRWIGANIHGDCKAKIGITYNLCSSTGSGIYADLKYISDNYLDYMKSTYVIDEYEKEDYDTNDKMALYKPIMNFTKLYDQWIKTYKNDTSEKSVQALEQFLDVESTLRLMAVDTLILPLDNFWLISSNTALYFNPEKNNYHFIPTDFDQSMVGSYDLKSLNPNNFMDDCITWANYNDSIYDHYFTNNLLRNPIIKQRYDKILDDILHTAFDFTNVETYLNGLGELITDDVEWNADAIKNLNIPYKEGNVKIFSMNDFKISMSYRHNGSDQRSFYELADFIYTRGKKCKAYTASVITSNNNN
ncbi:hypothetical protein PIROE2DRAFT_9924 [Piromyces sp. E2]|nr:hypothetical protein PIROE2DRAFT_9924 [Piromyces sp. E2]|eukprot:OUM63507.1 hypothetical protein PIROE2DRAFT_9924 [Piromyces sp. E2]